MTSTWRFLIAFSPTSQSQCKSFSLCSSCELLQNRMQIQRNKLKHVVIIMNFINLQYMLLCFSASPFALLSMLPFEQPQMTILDQHGNCFEMLGPFQRPIASFITRDHQYPSCICNIVQVRSPFPNAQGDKRMNYSILFESTNLQMI